MRRGYFPAVFLFAAFRLEPEGAAGEAGGIETALGATRWKLSTRRILPTRSSSGDPSSHSLVLRCGRVITLCGTGLKSGTG
jgi:hypothetical protein